MWTDFMHSDISVFDFISEMNSAWPERPTQRGQGYKPLERFKWLVETRADENGKILNGRETLELWNALKNYSGQRSVSGNWQPLGPILDDVTTRENIEGVGRVSCIAFHPTNDQIMLVGTPAGGLWKSSDGGNTWGTSTDDLPTLGISSIAFDPYNPNIVYAGTGDRDAGDSPGMGVLKSEDGGDTWNFINTGISTRTVGAIIVCTDQANSIVIATDLGIRRSIDGGATWTQASSNTFEYKDLAQHPTDPNILYATGAGRFYRSEDFGLTWTQSNSGVSNGTRMCVSVNAAEPDAVYLLRTNTYSYTGTFKSEDKGLTFTSMSTTPNIMGWSADGSSTGGQAWYDLCLAGDAQTPNVIYCGGIRLKKSVDGGTTWQDINSNFVHVDQHEMAINPHNQDLYVCNDGGLYRYVNNSEWQDISKGIVNAQIYRLGQSPHDGAKALNGFQDNGTAEFQGARWVRTGGGDGFECMYDYEEEGRRYSSIYYGELYRTSNSYINQKFAGINTNGMTEEGAWSTPYCLNADSSSTMFVGMKNIWRSKNIKHVEKDSIVWEKISTNFLSANTTDCNQIRGHYAKGSVLYASKGSRKMGRTDNAMADTVVWQNISTYLPNAVVPVNAIETHKTDSLIVYIAFNKNVYKSLTGGVSWTLMTPNLPDVAVNTIVTDTSSVLENLYIGTDLGIYYWDASMTDWVNFSSGFPYAARVTELEIAYDSPKRIRASTYGRGMWESDLYSPETNVFPTSAVWNSPNTSGEVIGTFDAEIFFYRNLTNVDVSDLTISDFSIENGTVNSVTGGPSNYTVNITPASFGQVKVVLPSNTTIDNFFTGNSTSDTLKLVFMQAPAAFGSKGPGGVGDSNDLAFWMRADKGALINGALTANDGDPVYIWQDQSGNNSPASQGNVNQRPTFVANNGVHTRPGIQFDGDNDFLQMNDVIGGRSTSAYCVVETDSILFNDHGWFASARVPNGYLLHPWKNDYYYHGEVLDLESQYSGSPIFYIGEATSPHIYGLIYEQDDLHQLFYTIFDDHLYPFPGINIGARDNTTPIDIRFGWDFDDRFGKGRMGENILYKRRLFLSHHTIVNNYLGAKYGLDLGLQARYFHPNYTEEVIGVGQENSGDKHEVAQGMGVLEISALGTMTDGNYLLVGSDVNGMNVSNTLYPFVSNRVERTYAFTRTGDAFSTTLRVPASELVGLNEVNLILSEAEAFSSSESLQVYPMNLVGDNYEISVSLPSSGVFTIGETPVLNVNENSLNQVSIFPVPSSEVLNVNVGHEIFNSTSYRIFSVDGKQVLSGGVYSAKQQLDISNLPSGVYVLQVQDSGSMVKKDFIKL
jgi:photosystem II stability/assembly factor-like uncharacterized protein